MGDFKGFLKDFAFGYALSYLATTLVEEDQRRRTERQGAQPSDCQSEEEVYRLRRALEKMNNE